MNIDVAFGQYFEGNSVIHRLDPRFKLVITILFIVVIFLAENVFSFLLLTAALIGLILLTRIPFKVILRGMKSLLFIILFTALVNVFWYKGETLLVDFHFIHIYLEGIFNALLIVLRVAILLCSTSVLLTYTTTPLGLTDGLEQLLSPLARIHVPVHEFSMMMTIALRFIPTLIEETSKIKNAQAARGADFSEGGLIKRARALIPILIPLFVSSFRRASDLANAMECRCYTGGEGRTRMNVLHAGIVDFVAVLLVVFAGAAVLLINKYAPGYRMSL